MTVSSDENKNPLAENTSPNPASSHLIGTEQNSRSVTSELIEKFEAFAYKRASDEIDPHKLTDGQLDKVLALMEKNEQNAYNYHCKKIDAARDVRLAEIKSQSSHHRTTRLIFVISAVAVVGLGCVILYTDKSLFIPFLTFLGGNLSGLGLSKLYSKSSKEQSSSNKTESEEGE